MIKNILICCLFVSFNSISQTLISGNASVYTDAGEGDFFKDSKGLIYIGLTDGSLQQLSHYEKVVIWAEEASSLSSNSAEWFFGNGATGTIGIPLVENWEAYSVSFNADIASNNAALIIDVLDVVSNAILFSFTASGATDNINYTELLSTPTLISAGSSLGFRTNKETGSVSDARVAVWLRRLPD